MLGHSTVKMKKDGQMVREGRAKSKGFGDRNIR